MTEVTDKPQLLLKHHLKQLKLPAFLAAPQIDPFQFIVRAAVDQRDVRGEGAGVGCIIEGEHLKDLMETRTRLQRVKSTGRFLKGSFHSPGTLEAEGALERAEQSRTLFARREAA